ncbi:MAG: hypothetical protein R6U61_07995 [Thermoplasmata archaeon]
MSDSFDRIASDGLPMARKVPEYERYLDEKDFKKGKQLGIWIRDSEEGRQVIDTRDGKVYGYSYDGAETPVDIAIKVRKLKKG